ncbi:hypothetical protein [Neptuniibacter sp. CAU 1671]|uniref:hypothetical protein n=1 Tax=Neptuniibacter sp. CAU 1671 TaxID=3032593 RepID=UPI0023DA0DD8|nr:hypothetical protein [Neptuniibacter sp. CAU 1671]MDF2181029.1 hypothetical protein [Neptuniibacter sp. CAU 1671]
MLKFCTWTNWLCLVVLGPLGLSGHAAAHDHFSINGFITQGYFLSDHNNVSGDSEDGSFDFRELGLNGSWRPAQNWLLSAQLMSRRMGKVNDGNIRVDFAQADYRFSDLTSGYFGVRAGRVKNPYGLYNETRDVAFTRPSAVLPTSIYLENTRNILLSSDGVMLYGSYGMEKGSIDSELLAGFLIVDTELEQGLMGFNAPGRLDDSPATFWRVMYRSFDQSLQYGLTLVHAKIRYDAVGGADIFPADGEITVDQLLLSYQYSWNRWTFTSEYLFMESELSGFGGVYADRKPNQGDAIYGQLEYRLSPTVSTFLRRELSYSNKHDRNGKTAAALSGAEPDRFYHRDWTLGIGWTPRQDWLLRAEIHKLKGTSALSPLENPDRSAVEPDWHLFILQATYRF